MTAAGWVVWRFVGARPGGEGNFILSANFRDAAGVPEGSAVVIAGLPIGQISGWAIEGPYARVRMQLRDDIQVWSNATIFKKSTSLLGAYYLEIHPGAKETRGPDGKAITNRLLESGERIQNVVEATSPDQLMRRIERSLPKVDAVLLSVRDLTEDVRRIVNGPVASIAGRLDSFGARGVRHGKEHLSARRFRICAH